MLAHAGMLEKSDSHFDIEECRREPERAWEEWKDQEAKHRYGNHNLRPSTTTNSSSDLRTLGSLSIKRSVCSQTRRLCCPL